MANKLGPIGKGWVEEIKTNEGTRFVARWNAFVLKDGERKRVKCGPHEVGAKVSHGPGLKTLKQAQDAWSKQCWEVFGKHHPVTAVTSGQSAKTAATGKMNVTDFIEKVYVPRRKAGWEDNSRINFEYFRDSFILPFFGHMSVEEMNNEDLVREFMQAIAARKFSESVARKAFTYTKSLIDTAQALGVILGNGARLIPKNQRVPKGIKKEKPKPFVSVPQFVGLLNEIEKPRDKTILKILFLCAVRRGELFVVKWKDFQTVNDIPVLNIERSFCARTHKVKEWTGKVAGTGSTPAKVVVPPTLASDLEGWRKFGDTTPTNPDSYIFPTRNGTPIIGTNWAEDVLKPAGARLAKKNQDWAALENVSYHWFRRGHATVQHHSKEGDKSIQGQLRHADAELTRNVYMQQVDPETYHAVINLEKAVSALLSSKK